MANVYVYSGAGGAGTGADWANAYTTLAAACTAKAAGDVFYIAHDHSETPATAITITSPGSDSTPCRAYCVDRTGTVPPVSADLRATAVISAAGSGTALILAGAFSELYGVRFSCGDGGATAATLSVGNTTSRSIRLVNCQLKLNNTSTTSRLNCASNSSGTICNLENTTMEFGSTGQFASAVGRVVWRNTPNAIVGATIPGSLLNLGVGWFLEGVDLSAVASGKTIFHSPAGSTNGIGVLKDCKLASGVTISSAPASRGAHEVVIIRSDSGDTNYRSERYTFTGTLTTETTIVRTGGATDGTTPISWKVVTPANVARPESPFETFPITIWNEIVGSAVTITVYGTKASGLPTNANIWIDVQYFGTSGFPTASKATNGLADGLATATTYSSDGSTWGGSLSSPGVFAMSVTVTPQEKGPITVYPKVGVSSTTVYIDPKLVIS